MRVSPRHKEPCVLRLTLGDVTAASAVCSEQSSRQYIAAHACTLKLSRACITLAREPDGMRIAGSARFVLAPSSIRAFEQRLLSIVPAYCSPALFTSCTALWSTLFAANATLSLRRGRSSLVLHATDAISTDCSDERKLCPVRYERADWFARYFRGLDGKYLDLIQAESAVPTSSKNFDTAGEQNWRDEGLLWYQTKRGILVDRRQCVDFTIQLTPLLIKNC